jgi:hypothetical protein
MTKLKVNAYKAYKEALKKQVDFLQNGIGECVPITNIRNKMTNHPTSNFEFDEEIETEFNKWFHGDYGPYSYRSEWCMGDIEIQDEKTRKDAIISWINSAFCAGYEASNYAKLEEQVGLTE